MRLDYTFTALLAASLSQAQYLISELSFGHAGRISPPESRGQIPNFNLQGNPELPEVLSNRIILTPLAPGNQRGAIWGEQTLQRTQWIADVDFRANGPDRGGGNLNIWLVRGGAGTVGASSVYTVGKFDGFVLTIDKQGGSGGIVRGFLNDGSIDYSSKQRVEELAFGHCAYSYRNLGRPSQVKMRQSGKSFRVEIDGNLCFETDKISIPQGYKFGVTAATPDVPDSFELFKMVVMSENTDSGSNAYGSNNVNNNNNNNNNNQQSLNNNSPRKDNFDASELADEDADIFQTSKAQFVDLHNRLQNTNHQLSALQRVSSRHQQQDEKRHEEVTNLIGQLRADLRKIDEISELQSRITELNREISELRKEVSRKLSANERSVRGILDNHHENLTDAVLNSTPGHKFLVIFILGSQCLLVVAFILYKKRRASMPKKYL